MHMQKLVKNPSIRSQDIERKRKSDGTKADKYDEIYLIPKTLDLRFLVMYQQKAQAVFKKTFHY